MGLRTCSDAGFISKLFFWWVNDLLFLGYKRELTTNDLSNQLRKSDSSKHLGYKLFDLWDEETTKGKKPSLFRAIRKQFGFDYAFIGLLPFFEECGIKIIQPILLGVVIQKLEAQTPPYLEAGIIILASILNVFTTHWFYFCVQNVGMRIRIATSCLIYRKCLRQLCSPEGRLLNLLSSDVQRFDQSSVYLHYLWIGPTNIILVFYILYYYFGIASLLGLGILLIFTCLQGFFGIMFSILRSRTADCTDRRMDFMVNMLKKMKQIKMLGLEDFYGKKCRELRRQEVGVIGTTAYFRTFNLSFFYTSVKILFLITIWWYNSLDTSAVFVMLSFYQNLRGLMTNSFPNGVLQFAEARVAINRIQTYLLEPEQEPLGGTNEKLTEISVNMKNVHLKCRRDPLNLNIMNGEIVSIIGSVGTGKTTLLQGILGEVKTGESVISVFGRIAYVPQTPWIYPASMKDNIVLNAHFDPNWYEQVLHAAALTDYGHVSLGNLSGGMRARISLARAAYSRADIYLFDDPFAALDSRTKRHVIQKLIQELLVGKIRIICGGDGRMGRVVALDKIDREFRRRQSMAVQDPSSTDREEIVKKVVEEEEVIGKGTVRWGTYFEYFHTGSGPIGIIILLLLSIFAQISFSGSDYYLRIWDKTGDTATGIRTYGVMVIVIVILSLLRCLFFFYVCLNSSVKLHDQIFSKVSRAHQEFLVMYGKILNRFGKDMCLIDETLPSTFLNAFSVLLNVTGTVVVISIVQPLLLPPAAVLSLVFYFLRRFYIRTSIALRRIEGIVRTPLYTLISSTGSGLSTIRSFKAEEKFLSEFTERLDTHSSSWYINLATSRWFGIWLDWISVLYTIIVIATFLVTVSTGSDVGLVISSVLALSGTFQIGARQSAEVENQMVAVERVLEYSKVPVENFDEGESDVLVSPPIEFIDVSIMYNDFLVLKNINLKINRGEKIALLGRTGSGKTTLLKTLYRLADYSGEIQFNGLESKKIKLKKLRSSLSIIPQDPYLFKGTIRNNLDPHGELTDNDICRVFNRFGGFFQGLDSFVEEDGKNLSQGQRQILSLVRVILKKNEILVLDEPTANLDWRTDQLIREALDEFCSKCTVITVAHRIWTIAHYDRAFLIQDGGLQEIPVPQVEDADSVPEELQDIVA